VNPTDIRYRPRERGAALITALIFLVILTIIGVTALTTTGFEQRMAVSAQEGSRAFAAAETGLQKAINEAGSFDVFSQTDRSFTLGDNGIAGNAAVETNFIGWAIPKRSASAYSNRKYRSANFDQKSTGTAGGGAKTIVHQGAMQIVNNPDLF